jgi:hypothetical protein
MYVEMITKTKIPYVNEDDRIKTMVLEEGHSYDLDDDMADEVIRNGWGAKAEALGDDNA